jgi:hypothetical protein
MLKNTSVASTDITLFKGLSQKLRQRSNLLKDGVLKRIHRVSSRICALKCRISFQKSAVKASNLLKDAVLKRIDHPTAETSSHFRLMMSMR